MGYIQTVYLTLDGTVDNNTIVAKQGDIGRKLQVYILDNNAKEKVQTSKGYVRVLSNTVSAVVRYVNANRDEILNDCTIEGNSILVELTEQMLLKDGFCPIDILVKDSLDSSRISTGTFKIRVNRAVHEGEQITAQPEYTTLINKISEADQTIASINEKASTLEVQYAPRLTIVESQLSEIETVKATKEEVAVVDARVTNLATLPVGSTTGDAELIDGRVGADGTIFPNIGGSIRVQISDIKENLTSKFEVKNMIVNSKLLHGYYIQGAGVGTSTLASNTDFYIYAVPVKPSTIYTIFFNYYGKEDSYYWQKVCTSKKEVSGVLLQTLPYTFDGSVAWSNTASYQSYLQLTTGAEDKSLFILVSKYIAPTYTEMLEGAYTSKQFTSYDDGIYPMFNAYTKQEVKTLINNNDSLFEITKESDTSLLIYQKGKKGYIKYNYFKHVDAAIGNNVWRLGAIYLLDSNKANDKLISPDWADNEGVLKISGNTDYSGGVHGDEVGSSFYIYVDGIMTDIASITSTIYCNEIKFIVKSAINNQDGTTKVFDKYKQTWFDKNGIHVNNRWIPANNVTLEHVRAILLSVDKGVISTYHDSIAFPIPRTVPSDASGSIADNRMTETFYSGTILSAHVWVGERGGDVANYRANVTDFTTRLKSYFDCYTGETVVAGKDIYCQNNFKLSC